MRSICIHIWLSMTRSLLPTLPCLCGGFRRTSRALTQLYESALRPLGLRVTQFTTLQVLSLGALVSDLSPDLHRPGLGLEDLIARHQSRRTASTSFRDLVPHLDHPIKLVKSGDRS